MDGKAISFRFEELSLRISLLVGEREQRSLPASADRFIKETRSALFSALL